MSLTIAIKMLPPTANHMWLLNRNGSRRLSAEAQMFRLLVQAEVNHSPAVVFGGPLSLRVVLTFGRRGQGDVDNRVKAAADALALALHFDDKLIRHIEAWDAGYDKGRPLTALTLSTWRGPAPAVVTSIDEALAAIGAIAPQNVI